MKKSAFKSRKVLLITWLFFTTFAIMFYESNLRSYLMSVDLEPPIDTDRDLLDAGQKLYMPDGAGFDFMYIYSGIEEKIALAKKARENREEQFYQFEEGQEPRWLVDRLLNEG